MISSTLPTPAPTLPVAAPAAAHPAPPAPGETAEQNPGGFARLLDQAREEPANAAAPAQNGDAAGEKTARTRALRTAQARPTAAKAEAPAETPLTARDRGDDAEMTVGSEAAPTDPATPPPANNADTAALLTSLAAFARPQAAPEVPAGKTAGAGGDEARTTSRPQGRAPLRLQQDGQAAQAAGPAGAGAATAAEPGAASAAGLTTESRAGAEPTAQAGSRSFAAELQATLANPGLAQPAATVASAANPTPAATTAAQGQLAASPGSPAFAPELGATLATFVRDGVHHARLELNPAEMGPLTVQIQLDGQTAQVHLAAQNADTRQALEQAMPTLAGSLREAGLTLGGGGVFEQPRQPQQQDGPGESRSGGPRGEADDPRGGQAQQPAAPPRRRGVVDLVA